MLDLVLSLVPGGGLTVLIGGVVALLGAVFGIYRAGMKRAEGNAAKKERDAYERHIEDVARANRARPGELSDDPHNRDRQD